jgi:cathepsin D
MKNSLAVNEDGHDYSYFATMKFGSEGKELYMLVDTGAANTWVMGSDCTTVACKTHNTFGKADSTTLEVSKETWSIAYGTGTVSGVVVNDTVAFAGFSLEMGFGSASTTSSDFDSYPMDGILGLGRPKSNRLGVPTVMQTLMNANLLKANLFGVHLQRNADGATDGQVNFGAVDTSMFDGDLHYTDSISTDGLWEIPIDDAGVDGNSAGLTGRTAIVDTGTSYVLMPPADAKKLHALIDGAVQDDSENWMVPCSSTVPVQFTFSGKAFDVSHKDYVGTADSDGKMCESNIIGHQAFGATQWLLGDVFLKNVYSVFDYEQNRIGMYLPFSNLSKTKANSAPPGFGVKSTTGKSQSQASTPGSSSHSISTPTPHTQSSKAQSSPTTSAPDNGNSPSPSSKGHILPVGSSASTSASSTSPPSASASSTASPSTSSSSSPSSGSASADSTTKASGQGLGSGASSMRLDMLMAVMGMSCSLLALLFSWA